MRWDKARGAIRQDTHFYNSTAGLYRLQDRTLTCVYVCFLYCSGEQFLSGVCGNNSYVLVFPLPYQICNTGGYAEGIRGMNVFTGGEGGMASFPSPHFLVEEGLRLCFILRRMRFLLGNDT